MILLTDLGQELVSDVGMIESPPQLKWDGSTESCVSTSCSQHLTHHLLPTQRQCVLHLRVKHWVRHVQRLGCTIGLQRHTHIWMIILKSLNAVIATYVYACKTYHIHKHIVRTHAHTAKVYNAVTGQCWKIRHMYYPQWSWLLYIHDVLYL